MITTRTRESRPEVPESRHGLLVRGPEDGSARRGPTAQRVGLVPARGRWSRGGRRRSRPGRVSGAPTPVSIIGFGIVGRWFTERGREAPLASFGARFATIAPCSLVRWTHVNELIRSLNPFLRSRGPPGSRRCSEPPSSNWMCRPMLLLTDPELDFVEAAAVYPIAGLD